ncbi:MAG: hypothetical protein EZS28_008543 [Streblomastix strix]|uniref:Uncharacterized protein n=1 Tax=Streblomastix strix TaxID=222440 RepID=A0A5J4WMB5_9EUKA|nr:MAG: hypothetical protein EZS28_008543 [Streblomastix strix]
MDETSDILCQAPKEFPALSSQKQLQRRPTTLGFAAARADRLVPAIAWTGLGISFALALILAPKKYVLLLTFLISLGVLFIPLKIVVFSIISTNTILIILALVGVFRPPIREPLHIEKMRTEHAEILEIGSASLLKVRLLKTNTDERVTASLTQKAKDEGVSVLEAGPAEFWLLVPHSLGVKDFNVGDYALFQRTRNPVRTIYQTEHIFKLLYKKDEAELASFVDGKANH